MLLVVSIRQAKSRRKVWAIRNHPPNPEKFSKPRSSYQSIWKHHKDPHLLVHDSRNQCSGNRKTLRGHPPYKPVKSDDTIDSITLTGKKLEKSVKERQTGTGIPSRSALIIPQPFGLISMCCLASSYTQRTRTHFAVLDLVHGKYQNLSNGCRI